MGQRARVKEAARLSELVQFLLAHVSDEVVQSCRRECLIAAGIPCTKIARMSDYDILTALLVCHHLQLGYKLRSVVDVDVSAPETCHERILRERRFIQQVVLARSKLL